MKSNFNVFMSHCAFTVSVNRRDLNVFVKPFLPNFSVKNESNVVVNNSDFRHFVNCYDFNAL